MTTISDQRMKCKIKKMDVKPGGDLTPRIEIRLEFEEVEAEGFAELLRTWADQGNEVFVQFSPAQLQLFTENDGKPGRSAKKMDAKVPDGPKLASVPTSKR